MCKKKKGRDSGRKEKKEERGKGKGRYIHSFQLYYRLHAVSPETHMLKLYPQ